MKEKNLLDPFARIKKPHLEEIVSWIRDNDPGFDTIEYKTMSGQKVIADSVKCGYFGEKNPMPFSVARKCFKIKGEWKTYESKFQYADIDTSKWKDKDAYDCYVVFVNGFNHFVTIYK